MTDYILHNATSVKALSPAATRALKEASARRELRQQQKHPDRPTEKSGEKSGPKGSEPTRFGDWERDGIAYDF